MDLIVEYNVNADRYSVDEKPDLFLNIKHEVGQGRYGIGICRIRHEANSVTDLFESRRYDEEEEEISISSLHYDAQDEAVLYFSRTKSSMARLYRMRLNETDRELVFDQEELWSLGWPFTSFLITNTAYDWAAKNLYMNLHYFVGVINIENPWNISVILKKREFISDIAVHPNRGYFFFVDKASLARSLSDISIYRAHLDGSNIVELRNTRSSNKYMTNIMLDFYEDKLYWSIPESEVIQYSNLDGSDIRTVNNVRVHYDVQSSTTRTLAIDRHYVYYLLADSKTVRRLEKGSLTEERDYEVYNREQIKEIMVFTYASQKVRNDHPCRIENSNCPKYCFAVPDDDSLKDVCACSFLEDTCDEVLE